MSLILLKLSNVGDEEKQHNHTALFSPNENVGVSSRLEDHNHEVRMITEMTRDPESGQEYEAPILDEEGFPQWEVSETEGHSHGVSEVITEEPIKMPELSESDKMKRALELHSRAEELNREFITTSEELEGYLMDDPYNPAARAQLKARGASDASLNLLQSRMQLLSGIYRSNRMEITYKPNEKGDVTTAAILSEYCKLVQGKSGMESIDAEVFEDQSGYGRGSFNVDVDFTESVKGEIKIAKEDFREVLMGPHTQLDGSDMQYAIYLKWMNRSAAKVLFPHKAKEIDDLHSTAVNMASGRAEAPVVNADYPDGAYLGSKLKHELMDLAKDNIRIIEVQEKLSVQKKVAYITSENWFFNISGLDSETQNQIITLPGVRIARKADSKVVYTQLAGTIFLDYGDLIFRSIPSVPVYALKKGFRIQGKLGTGKGIQDHINKRSRQLDEILNSAANYGWLLEPGGVARKQKQAFKSTISTPGFILDVGNLDKIKKVEGTRFPNEIFQAIQSNTSFIDEILGINSGIFGVQAKSNSPKDRMNAMKHILLSNIYLFDHMTLSKKRTGRLLLEAIVLTRSPEDLYRALNPQDGSPPRYSMEQISAALNPEVLEGIDVLVEEDVYRDSNLEAALETWTEIFARYQALPATTTLRFLLSLSNVPGKEDFLATLDQWEQQQARSAQTQESDEILKSLPDDMKRMHEGLPPEGLSNEQYMQMMGSQQPQKTEEQKEPEGF